MKILLCMPVAAIMILLFAWLFISEGFPFSRLRMTKFRLLLEPVVCFILAGAIGWYSVLLSQVILESDGEKLNMLWLILHLMIFIFFGYLTLALGMKDTPSDMARYDLIAVGVGYLAGLLFAGYQVMVRHYQPPRLLYLLWWESDRIFLFLFVGIIVLLIFRYSLGPSLRQKYENARRLITNKGQIKEFAAPGIEPENDALTTAEDQVVVDENPSTSANI